jgi:hypothetical protein
MKSDLEGSPMTRRLFATLGAALALLLAPSPGAPQEEKPKQDPDPMKAKTEKHKRDVVRLRGLEFSKPVTVGVYSKKELVDFLKTEFEKELPKEKADRYQRGYAKFGFIPKDMDLHEAYMELFGSSIAGFYHPKTKELRLIRAGEEEEDADAKLAKAMGMDMEAITIVHELTHAAQDQNYELSTLPLEDETNDDLIMALKGVIEGDASAVGWKYQFPGKQFDLIIGGINKTYQSGMLPGKAGKLPAYLRLNLTFPYGHGTEFVVQYLKGTKGELKDASKLFKDWPLSTEQILHPKKYYGEERDNPMLLAVADAPKTLGGGWKESFNNVHGEFCVRLFLQQSRGEKLDDAAVLQAAEGWDGDRYVVLEREGKADADGKKAVETMYVWVSTWDSEDDAKEFAEAALLAFEKRYGVARKDGEAAGRAVLATQEDRVLVERKGSDVLVLDGAPEDALAKADALWKSVSRKEMTGFERLRKFVCDKDGVKEAFSGKCPKCGAELRFDDPDAAPKKKRREY